ncbi:RHS repeat-associated core domain-containing protein [Roseobacter sp. YSTF-M11]|uniref:RHS repeat-associated core domain-containing protein n=1 Tax=Roseobacter insulae TaxID=2859783 RepID=A0A9X1FWS7_9RHOB|nr:RHS repeat-associated core domain-containing protein [Roseobacter insulae]MBW4709001.1 RHS repeat-associated core domain-containing protein [Roseobacter insulae]
MTLPSSAATTAGDLCWPTEDVGVKVWEASYLPFGGVHTSTGSNPDLRFPGQFFQSENGLHQNWMRDFDPTTGRYIQADPLGLVDGASVYGYALQNPNRYTDPQGLTVGPGHKNYERCKNLEKRMKNLRKKIEDRKMTLK